MTSAPGAQPNAATPARAALAGVRTISHGQLIIAGTLLLAALVAVFWVFVKQQVMQAFEQPADWGHTLFVPFMSAYFAYLKKDEILAQPFKANWLGLPIVLFGVAAYVAATFGPSWFVLHHNARGVAIGITLLGLSLQILGWRATKYLLFPLAYWVVFGQTVSDRILQLVTQRMQDWSAVGAFWVLALCGVDVDRSGNVITVFVDGKPNQLNVAEACSGMRMLVAFLALGVAIAYTGLTVTWQRIALVLSGVPVAIGVNVLRVFTLGILSLYDANFAAGDFHSFIGLVWLMPALVFYLGIMWFLRNLFVDSGAAKPAAAAAASPAAKKGGDDAR
ncbi:MAG: exosortase/archaeosortase family protein [bacterium]|jgi:exosortase